MRWFKRINQYLGGGLFINIIALASCVGVFLAADSLIFRFAEWRMFLEPVKDLSLAATAALTVVLIDHSVTIRKVAAEVAADVESRMVDVMETFISASKDTGLVRIHKRLDFARLFESLGPGDELLWLDTYCPANSEFFDKIRPALERGAKIKWLIIDPRSVNAEYRGHEIELETFTQEVELFAKRVSSVNWSRDGFDERSCQILAYDDLPGMPMYIVTHKGVPVRGYSGFFLAKPSAFFAHLEWTLVKDGVLENMHDYFQQKWNKHLHRTKEFPSSVHTETKILHVNQSPRQRKLRTVQPT